MLAEAVSCLNRALSALGDIWEEIGIPEELRVERTGAVKKHVKVSGAPGRAGPGGERRPQRALTVRCCRTSWT